MEFSGRLTAFPPSDLLQWALNDRRTGALVVRRSEREKRVYFQAGEVMTCLSNDPAEYYGQHLLLHGHLEQDQLFQALPYCTTRGVRLGPPRGELGLMTPEKVQRTLLAHTGATICDPFL